jgi:hypothetical protein
MNCQIELVEVVREKKGLYHTLLRMFNRWRVRWLFTVKEKGAR